VYPNATLPTFQEIPQTEFPAVGQNIITLLS